MNQRFGKFFGKINGSFIFGDFYNRFYAINTVYKNQIFVNYKKICTFQDSIINTLVYLYEQTYAAECFGQ